MYRTFIKCCVFSKIVIYIPDSGLSRFPLGGVSVCVHNDRSNTSAAAELAEFRSNHSIWRKKHNIWWTPCALYPLDETLVARSICITKYPIPILWPLCKQPHFIPPPPTLWLSGILFGKIAIHTLHILVFYWIVPWIPQYSLLNHVDLRIIQRGEWDGRTRRDEGQGRQVKKLISKSNHHLFSP